MVQYIPAPEPRNLLPPLLACLPTAFVSPRPPPALLPLLSPILRQRVNLLAGSGSAGTDGWLPLLSWDSERATKLKDIVVEMNPEPHPVSGEIELQDVENIRYRRLDEETLQSRLEVDEFGLLPIYLWCTGDQEGGGDGWRLAELRGLEDLSDGTEWYESKTEADEAARRGIYREVLDSAPTDTAAPAIPDEDEGDDDDYWASYDRTPGRTPAKLSPAPPAISSATAARLETGRERSTSELEYFARYASEVQPALDAHDPEEGGTAPGESTLNGGEISEAMRQARAQPTGTTNVRSPGYEPSLPQPYINGQQHDSTGQTAMDESFHSEISHPRPSSPSSQGSVARLELEAASQSQMEIGVKQHISTDIKSLFRLARTAGIDRQEFERIVKTELEVLSLLEADD
ncbi:hypothetical protein BJ546DRAFT_884763 [Cryomyces antarcticus]